MGSVFAHVSDDALRPLEDDAAQCQCCERVGLPIFDYSGSIIAPERAANPAMAREHPDIYELCAACINSGIVAHWTGGSAAKLIARFASAPETAWQDFHRLPDTPLFMQDFDWPICCGNWCEFTGSPDDLAALIALQTTHGYWEQGPADHPRNFARDGGPESLLEVSTFRCQACAAKYYVDQFS